MSELHRIVRCILCGRFCKAGAQSVATRCRCAGDERAVAGVAVGGETLAADAVIVAMGPWSGAAAKWLGVPLAVSGQKYHSAVLRTDADVTNAALFTSVREHAGGKRKEPEIYPRPHGEVRSAICFTIMLASMHGCTTMR